MRNFRALTPLDHWVTLECIPCGKIFTADIVDGKNVVKSRLPGKTHVWVSKCPGCGARDR